MICKVNKSVKRICLFFFVVAFAASCSPKRNTFVNRQYHDVNAYFNVLFNGRDSYNTATKRVEAIEPEAFDEILPVFAFEYPQVPGSVVGEMQRVIDKANKTIQKHSITAKPKSKKGMTREQREFYNKREFNIFVDDAQLLIGKANMYLHEYALADEKFTFVNSEYPTEESIYEAQVWNAVTDIQTQKYTEAADRLRSMSVSKKFPDKLKPLLNAAYADLNIKQKNYSDAIKYLEKALSKTHKKATKIRYSYILAQLYQKSGNNIKALEYYGKVLRRNPPYFTAFNAEMAMAFSYDSTNRSANVRKTLEKALKDQRNDEYHDQIYYALAKVEESSGNAAKAVEYYQKSIEAGGTNNRQKAQSYLALAEFYVKLPDYVQAYSGYDNAARLFNPEHSMYEETAANALKLRKLAVNMQIVEREDSLQRLANMSESERDKIIDAKIKQAEESQRQTETEEQQMQQSRMQADRNMPMDKMAQQTSGQWYFYNTTAITLGRTDFDMRWGKRKLEDNWRRRNRSVQFQNSYDELADDEYGLNNASSENAEDKSKTDRETYLTNIPATNEARQASDEKIVQAMFYIGEAYRDDLNNLTAAAKAMEALNERFPQNAMEAAVYVALYELYRRMGNENQASHYKNLMLSKHANNPLVLAATDAGYIGRMQAKEAEEEAAFGRAIAMYSSGRKEEAYQAAVNEMTRNPDGRLVPQYALLASVADNYAGDAGKYQNALQNIVEKYPKSAAAASAKKLLEDLSVDELAWASKNISSAQKQDSQKDESSKTDTDNRQQTVSQKSGSADMSTKQVEYSKDDGVHYFIVALDAKENVNKLQFNLIKFNADEYLNNNYEVQTVDFGGDKLLICGKMKNKKEAMVYYNKITGNAKIFEGMSIDAYAPFAISESNLKLFRENKSPLAYASFFMENYF